MKKKNNVILPSNVETNNAETKQPTCTLYNLYIALNLINLQVGFYNQSKGQPELTTFKYLQKMKMVSKSLTFEY